MAKNLKWTPALAAVTILAAACTPSRPPQGRPAPVPPNPVIATPVAGTQLDVQRDAEHYLDRLTFGARPGDLRTIENMGTVAWLDRQLHPDLINDHATDSVLALLETQRKKPYELLADHPEQQEVALHTPDTTTLRRLLATDSAEGKPPAEHWEQLQNAIAFNLEHPNRTRTAQQAVSALNNEIIPAKIIRAQMSQRQLLEVMTDFWENHFSVSINKSPNRYAIVEYDRDVIRPHALGRFRDLLGAVAKSPMMLYYLDNYQSTVDSLHPSVVEGLIEARRRAEGPPFGDSAYLRVINRRRSGVNENYGRELMELHTLGVDGGYTQKDVQEVSRCLTGWTIDQPNLGGEFLFRQDQHDGGPKTVLGVSIPAGRGIEDGEEVLDILARSPATAHFIARKLVTHFVSDSAPPALVDRAAQTFIKTDGDIAEVIRTIVTSPEFNSAAAYRAKIKTPFELVVSALRAMNAAPDTTQRIAQQVSRLGQPIWAHLTPEGWPDHGDAWMNAGALLNRVNFGTAIGAGQIPGAALTAWHPADSLAALKPHDQVQGVIDYILGGDASPATRDALFAVMAPENPMNRAAQLKHLGDLVGVAIGSPEFQRR